MPRVIIDPTAPEPAYVQVAAIIRERIEDGTYPPRTAILSITAIVTDTGLAIGTIRKAVRVLVDEGLVETVSGHGTFVRPPGSRTPRQP